MLIFFQNFFSTKNSFRNTIRVSNSVDPDLARHFVGPDLGPNCLPRFEQTTKGASPLADKIIRQRLLPAGCQ